MQAKISKTLEAIIARTAFETSKRAITHSLKDFLTLEILREEGSLAHQILTSRLKDWEIHQICASHRKRDSVGIGTRFIEAESRRIFPFIHQRITTIVRPDAPCFDGTRTAAHRERPAHDHFAGAGHVPFRCTGDSDRTAKDDLGGQSEDAFGYRFSADTRTTVHRPARTCPGHSSCGTCLVGQIRHRPYVRRLAEAASIPS